MPMTDDDLIASLCVRVGTIMEDASVVAFTVRSESKREAAIGQLERASDCISALVGAAKALADYD